MQTALHLPELMQGANVRVAAISDTHGRQNWVMPQCDLIIHAGDMTGRGSLQETEMFAANLRERMSAPGGPQQAILLPGNHDECFEKMPGAVRDLFDQNVHILYGESLALDELCFYGVRSSVTCSGICMLPVAGQSSRALPTSTTFPHATKNKGS